MSPGWRGHRDHASTCPPADRDAVEPPSGQEKTKSKRLTWCTTTPRSASVLILIFIEIPLLLRICPTSSTFDGYVRMISTNYTRAGAYGVMAIIQWLSIIARATSLIAEAIVLSFAALCYLAAGIKGQAFVGSKTLGGAGVAQMIV